MFNSDILLVMWHVSTMMNSEGHRRLIGNDIGAIFFQEETPFEVATIDKLGTVPQVFFVVQPSGNKYKLASLRRVNVKHYGPDLPKDFLFDSTNLVDLLLSKRTRFSFYSLTLQSLMVTLKPDIVPL